MHHRLRVVVLLVSDLTQPGGLLRRIRGCATCVRAQPDFARSLKVTQMFDQVTRDTVFRRFVLLLYFTACHEGFIPGSLGVDESRPKT